jgi:phosphoribosyl 1,2-cyclic phosphate phosphodiesterase
MLREDVRQLDALLFTHGHKDHTAGLDDVRAFNFLQAKDMPVYGHHTVLDQLHTEFHYAFEATRYPGIPQLQLFEITEQPFDIFGLTFTPLPVTHLRMPVFGFRVNDFSYITDANFIPEATLQRLVGTKILVLNALQQEKHISHFNLAEAITMAQQIGAEHTYFTHISHKMGLHKEVEKELPPSITLAYDGLTVTL